MRGKIVSLPGDGIGPEVMASGLIVLETVAEVYGHSFDIENGLIGGVAIDAEGDPLPETTIGLCDVADAVLLGSVGGPQWDDPSASVRPEQGLLRLRKHFGLFANLRPVRVFPALRRFAPLKESLLEGVDLLFVRELTGGIYFGERREQDGNAVAHDTMLYTVSEVERVAAVAFKAAESRRKRVTSVDKANVLAAMRLWRRTVMDVHTNFPDITLEHLLVDAATMHLLTRPSSFDVILAGNLFGDILSDEASVLAGSLGMLPSGSLGGGSFGVYEPVHGSAPDIAGQSIANPIGMILSVAMMLRYSFSLAREADAIERAVEGALVRGLRTADIAPNGSRAVSTQQMTDAVVAELRHGDAVSL